MFEIYIYIYELWDLENVNIFQGVFTLFYHCRNCKWNSDTVQHDLLVWTCSNAVYSVSLMHECSWANAWDSMLWYRLHVHIVMFPFSFRQMIIGCQWTICEQSVEMESLTPTTSSMMWSMTENRCVCVRVVMIVHDFASKTLT